MEEMSRQIQKGFRSFENSQMELSRTADELLPRLDTLSSLLSSINTIHGDEYAIRLRTLLDNYQKGKSLPDPEVIGFLLERLQDSLTESVEIFPRMEKDKGKVRLPGLEKDERLQQIRHRRLEKRPFKWILFQRQRSLFIVSYYSIEIVDNYASGRGRDQGRIYFTWQGKEHYCRDILYSKQEDIPDHILVLDGGKRFIPADRIIRRIYSRKDIISEKLEPFKDIKTDISPGRVRLFGKKCIVL